MKYNPQKHHRRSIRLPDYDYSQPGAYFITMVAYQRECLFGEIVNGELQLSGMGQIAEEHWRLIPEHFQHVELGAYVVMPNHVHGIIVIHENGLATNSSPAVGASHWDAPTITNILFAARQNTLEFIHTSNRMPPTGQGTMKTL